MADLESRFEIGEKGEVNEEIWRKKFQAVQEGSSLEDARGRKGNILVIAPHPDDDVLGAGGTMAEASTQGRGVFSVYVTDGRGSPRKDRALSDEALATQRKWEALAALGAVSATGGFFLQHQSSELGGKIGQQVGEDLIGILEWLRPEEIFLPAPYERHRTHQNCTRLSLEALRGAKGLKPLVLGYSLWGSFWGEKKRVVRDITPFIKKKVEAVLAHASQIAYKNYQQGILGKNNYEAIFWESHEPQKAAFVEIFLDMTELLEKKDLSLEGFIREDLETFIRTFL